MSLVLEEREKNHKSKIERRKKTEVIYVSGVSTEVD